MIRGLLAVLASAAALSSVPEPAPVRLDRVTVLIPGALHPGRQPDGNSVLIVGERGVLVIDTGRHAAHGAAIERAIAATGKPLVAIVSTHWHLDHVSGNLRLKAAWPQVRVSASDAIDAALTGFLKSSADGARAALAAGKLPDTVAEEVRGDLATFERGAELRPDDLVVQSGVVTTLGRPLELRLARRAATAGDVWVYDPQARRAVVGDLVTLPAPFLDTACAEGWRTALGEVAAAPFRSLVPGHGPVLDRAGFATWRTAFDRFVACANGAAPPATCGAGWARDVARLLPAAERSLAKRMATAYAGAIRGGGLRKNCA